MNGVQRTDRCGPVRTAVRSCRERTATRCVGRRVLRTVDAQRGAHRKPSTERIKTETSPVPVQSAPLANQRLPLEEGAPRYGD